MLWPAFGATVQPPTPTPETVTLSPTVGAEGSSNDTVPALSAR